MRVLHDGKQRANFAASFGMVNLLILYITDYENKIENYEKEVFMYISCHAVYVWVWRFGDREFGW
jgi:hypothetical protein